jgi:XTP/dITP diphosphohydrolase
VSPRVALLLATRSTGKLRELAPMLRDAGFDPLTLADAGIAPAPAEDHIEVFDTFEENALAKARYFFGRVRMQDTLGVDAPGVVLADDSGLEVTALDGAPGVRSKRYSGSALDGQALDDANNAKLTASLRGARDRSARYVCVAAIKSSRGEWNARGTCEGRIVAAPSGTDGFGYDPYFFSEELQKTFGDATREEKERVSHRARAVAAVLERFGRGGLNSA